MADEIELSEIELTEFSRNNKNWTLAPEISRQTSAHNSEATNKIGKYKTLIIILTGHYINIKYIL